MKKINYINLTNGLEFIDCFDNVKYIRIQSTLLEAKKWNKIIYELDYGFLIDLALGNNISIIDATTKDGFSRALYQGIPWIEYVLNKYWLNKEIVSLVKTHNCSDYFKKIYKYELKKCTILKLKYTKFFVLNSVKKIKIQPICFSNLNKEKGISILKKNIK